MANSIFESVVRNTCPCPSEFGLIKAGVSEQDINSFEDSATCPLCPKGYQNANVAQRTGAVDCFLLSAVTATTGFGSWAWCPQTIGVTEGKCCDCAFKQSSNPEVPLSANPCGAPGLVLGFSWAATAALLGGVGLVLTNEFDTKSDDDIIEDLVADKLDMM